MSIPTDTAARSAARDSVAALELPKSATAARPLSSAGMPGVTSAPKPGLASSIQALKDLATKSGPSATPAASQGLTDEPLVTAYEKRIHTLQDSLKERDQVVQMLTQRLEQAADQLDRLQRTGGGRGGGIAAGIPPELIENQQTMAAQMTQLLGQWEELQAAQMLTRIESQLSELHDLVASGATAPANLSAIAVTSTSVAKEKEKTKEKEQARPPAKASVGTSVFADILAADPVKVGWEAIKAAMMDGESSNTVATNVHTPAAKPHATPEPSATESRDSESAAVTERPAPSPLPEPPAAVDFDIADQAMLVEAIRSRDEFISILLRRLSSPDASTEFPDWEKLNFVPEDLHGELLQLRDRLQEKLRVAEVDLSLQRAKLAREEARLSIKADQVARQIRQLGLSPEESGSQVSGSRALNEGSNATQGRRWLQFLQRSNGSGSGTDSK